MKTIVDSTTYENAKGMYEGALWKTWADFSNDHDLVDAQWFVDSPLMSEMTFYHITDNEEEFPDIFQFYFVEHSTIEDIKRFNISVPYFEHFKKNIYIIGVDHWGTCWSYVYMEYLLDDEE